MSKIEQELYRLCEQHEFERYCGADVKYISHTLTSENRIEYTFAIHGIAGLSIVGYPQEPQQDKMKLAKCLAEQAQGFAERKTGKSNARMELIKKAKEEKIDFAKGNLEAARARIS